MLQPDFSDPIVVLEVLHLDGTVSARCTQIARRDFCGCRQIGKTRKTPALTGGLSFKLPACGKFTTLPPSRALTLTGFLTPASSSALGEAC